MNSSFNVAVLGSTGYVGLELLKFLIVHPNVKINFLGSENHKNFDFEKFNTFFKGKKLPNLDLNNNFNPKLSDVVFLALPHNVSHTYVKKFFNKIKIIDLSADFRFDSISTYSKNYNDEHSCPELLNEFVYGLPELNKNTINNNNNMSIPGCYPTSILLPLIPLLQKNLLKTDNIIIDSKSGYSGAGKKFDISAIKNNDSLNFYNYNTNNHRHICEINQEFKKLSKSKVNFSFNPHILPIYRGMMSTIYCDLIDGVDFNKIEDTLLQYYANSAFVKIIINNNKADFFSVQNTNNCLIKLFKHHSNSKIIIVSLIDNLIKGAAGQAVQCFNLMLNLDESTSLLD